MGQLLRDEVAAQTEVGKTVDAILRAGELVSDEVAASVLKARLARPDTAAGYILDGYPRNLSQYKAFSFDTPTRVIVIDLPEEESLKRLGGRLTCTACGKVLSVADGHQAGEACHCGGKFEVRADDTPDAIRRRLAIYRADTEPVIAEYDRQGLVRRVDGVGSVEEVFKRVLANVES